MSNKYSCAILNILIKNGSTSDLFKYLSSKLEKLFLLIEYFGKIIAIKCAIQYPNLFLGYAIINI